MLHNFGDYPEWALVMLRPDGKDNGQIKFIGKMKKLNKEQLERCKQFLDYFGVEYDGEVIFLTDGGNSCIMNPNTEWKEFLGHSINSVAEVVAFNLNKKVIWRGNGDL